MNAQSKKKAVAEKACHWLKSKAHFDQIVLGVGTGSTVNEFIALIPTLNLDIEAFVSSSEASTLALEKLGFEVSDLNHVNRVDYYIDGADETTEHRHLVKGGGAALTREKIIAGMADKFLCIADDSKLVPTLGKFPLPVEVIPMARSFVARELVKLGGQPAYREGVVTDNGNHILDIHNLRILDPIDLELTINQIPGIVTVGLFAKRGADVVMLADDNGDIQQF